jgi:hypothetical protein
MGSDQTLELLLLQATALSPEQAARAESLQQKLDAMYVPECLVQVTDGNVAGKKEPSWTNSGSSTLISSRLCVYFFVKTTF